MSFKVLMPQPIAGEGIELLLASELEVVEPPRGTSRRWENTSAIAGASSCATRS